MKNHLKVHILSTRIDQDIADIRELIKLTEQHLQTKSRYLRSRVSAELNSALTKEETDFLIGWYDDDFVRLDNIYPNIQRRALFTALLSMTEADMLLCCHLCQSLLGIPMYRSIDGRRKTVQMLAYLHKHLAIRDSMLEPFWARLNELWSIRNALVHNDGIPNRSDIPAINSLCASTPTIELDDRNRIVLKKGSVQMALRIVASFFTLLIREIKNNKLPKPPTKAFKSKC